MDVINLKFKYDRIIFNLVIKLQSQYTKQLPKK